MSRIIIALRTVLLKCGKESGTDLLWGEGKRCPRLTLFCHAAKPLA